MAVKIRNTENFDTLRQAGGYYVDKTVFLEKFLESPSDASLFTYRGWSIKTKINEAINYF